MARRRKLTDDAWVGLPAWAKPMYLNAERRSKERGRPVFLTLPEFAHVVARAGGRCEVTGIEFDETTGRTPFSPSIDRIECGKGYIAGNVRLVCLAVNVAMNNWGIEPLLTIARRLVAEPLPQTLSQRT